MLFQRRLRCRHRRVLCNGKARITKLNGGGRENWLGSGSFGTVQLTQQPRQAKHRAAAAVHHRHNATPERVGSNANQLPIYLYILYNLGSTPSTRVWLERVGRPPC